MNQDLNSHLSRFRNSAKSEREKGTYFEELILTYLRHEATYRDLYSNVWTYADWAREQGRDGKDAGIDLVAKTRGTDEFHAIQCKFFDEDYHVQKKDIDSFFTASGKKPFTHRVIVTTTNNWSEHAEDALQGQNPPVRVYQMPRIFPDAKTENLVICVSGIGHRGKFSSLMAKNLPSMNFADMDNNQCFPLYLYETSEVRGGDLFEDQRDSEYRKKDGITNEGLKHFQAAYPSETIIKEDVFYYIYGLLHSEEYREKYADNLSKQLPRIPCVKTAEDFWAFSKAGRHLAELHVNYEKVKPFDVTLEISGRQYTKSPEKLYYVTKMKFGKKGDKSIVSYNDYITIRDIPLDAYHYVVNGQSALEWVMEMQSSNTNVSPQKKKSGIVNDANLYATETVGNPAYPLELFQRIITVSLETMKIVKSLPKLDIQIPREQKVA